MSASGGPATLGWDILVFSSLTLLQCVGYITLRNLLYPTSSPADVKRRAWLLSTAVSGLFSCVVYPLISLPALAAVYSGADAFNAFLAAESPLHRTFCHYFLSFMLLDCVIGFLDYGEHLRLDTTWAHHTVIGLFLVVFLRTNTCLVFLLAAPFEVPTFILSLGSLLPAYRNDCAWVLALCAPSAAATLTPPPPSHPPLPCPCRALPGSHVWRHLFLLPHCV